jgi:hypothetical protein
VAINGGGHEHSPACINPRRYGARHRWSCADCGNSTVFNNDMATFNDPKCAHRSTSQGAATSRRHAADDARVLNGDRFIHHKFPTVP